MAIIVDTGANIPAPSGAILAPPYDTVIGADSALVDWWMPDLYKGDSHYLTLASGLVNVLASRKATGGTNLTQAAANAQPTPLTNQINGRQALQFARSTTTIPDRFPHVFPAGSALDWTKVLVVRGDDGASPAVQQDIWSTANGTGGHQLRVVSGTVHHRVGGSSQESFVIQNIDWSAWNVIVASWQASTGTSALSVNGGAFTTGVNALAVCNVTSSAIGSKPADSTNAGWNGRLAFAGVYNVALQLSPNATKLNWLKQFIRDRYALTMA